MAVFCVACGSEIKPNHSFRGKCGTKNNKDDVKNDVDAIVNTQTLEIFSSNREKQRQSFFKTKKTKRHHNHPHQQEVLVTKLVN